MAKKRTKKAGTAGTNHARTREKPPASPAAPPQLSALPTITPNDPGTDDKRRERFLRLMAAGAPVSVAATGAGTSRTSVYRWRDEDPRFAQAWKDAEEEKVDRLEFKALQLANAGSERLIEIMLAALRPEKYRRNHVVKHEGKIAVNLDEARASYASKFDRLAAAAATRGVARKPE